MFTQAASKLGVCYVPKECKLIVLNPEFKMFWLESKLVWYFGRGEEFGRVNKNYFSPLIRFSNSTPTIYSLEINYQKKMSKMCI